MASQMLAGKGFENVLNMAGGIKAWDDPVAMGPQEQGLALFDGAHEVACIEKACMRPGIEPC